MADRRRVRRWAGRLLLVATVLLGVVSRAPAVLAFPHQAQIGATRVYAEQPITPRLAIVLARADALVAASPLAGGDLTRTVVLTDGGWRWRLIALTSHGAFGLRRPFSSMLALNRSDIARDRVFNGRAIGGERTLSGTIAHETAHLLTARRFGEVTTALAPTWLNEGLADVVARESSLSDADATRLRQTDPDAPALSYYDARRRVAAALVATHDDLDTLYRRNR